jgi:Protein of unknown function (DUF3828)
MNRRDAETQRKSIQNRFNLRFFVKNIFGFILLRAFASLRFILLVSALSACSIPNLESPECTEARSAVREFYSFHIGNDLKPSAENLKLREKFLSKELINTLSVSNEAKKDYFTATEDYPKAFRVGGCEAVSPEKTVLEVLLFWRDDVRSEQREIKVEAVKENGKWLIDKVSNRE